MLKFSSEPIAFAAYHSTYGECTLYKNDEAIAEKYFMPIEGADGDEFVLEEQILEQGEYMYL